ncbi:MAG: glycosyltransferase family 4 protein [Candidatus Aureabacteria bacterium]|nr:glycosyltransferase family 4 protein [Candidatus Auribacterota bacterium]
MKICIEAQPFVAKRTGVGRYTYCLIESFAKRDLDCDISVFYFNARRNFKDQEMIKKNPRMKNKEIKYIPGFIAYKLWTYFSTPKVEFYAGEHDLYHFTNFVTLPVKKGKKLVTVYDASFKRFPEFAEEKNKARLERMLEETLDVADGLAVISEFTKKEIVTLFKYPEDKIFVTHLGVDDCFKKVNDIAKLDAIKIKYKINGPFLLFTGTLEPRKNIPLLIKAFNILAKNTNYHLVIIGRCGWSYESILKEIEESRFSDRIHHLGYVKETDLPLMYSAADMFVFPTFYEGFGLPPLEAMRSGTLVISSDQASLKEVLKDGVVYFDPFKTTPDDLYDIIIDHIRNDAKRELIIKRGFDIANSYTWEKTADKTLEIYKKI